MAEGPRYRDSSEETGVGEFELFLVVECVKSQTEMALTMTTVKVRRAPRLVLKTGGLSRGLQPSTSEELFHYDYRQIKGPQFNPQIAKHTV